MILFHKRVMSCFYRYPFFIFQTIPSISKIVASGWVLAMKIEYVFEYVFWIRTTCLVMKLDHLIDIVIDNIFRKYFAWLEILGSKLFSFFFTNLLQLIESWSWWFYVFFNSFEDMCKWTDHFILPSYKRHKRTRK